MLAASLESSSGFFSLAPWPTSSSTETNTKTFIQHNPCHFIKICFCHSLFTLGTKFTHKHFSITQFPNNSSLLAPPSPSLLPVPKVLLIFFLKLTVSRWTFDYSTTEMSTERIAEAGDVQDLCADVTHSRSCIFPPLAHHRYDGGKNSRRMRSSLNAMSQL